VTTIDMARAELETARHLEAAERDRLADANAKIEAKKANLNPDDPRAPTDLRRARSQRDQREDIHAARARDVEAAKKKLEALEREADEAELQRLIVSLESLPDKLHPALARLSELRGIVWAVRQELASAVVESDEHYDEAERLAAKLQRPYELQRRASRPSMSDALLLAAAWAALDDQASGLEDPSDCVRAANLELAWNSQDRPALDAAIATVKRMKAETTKGNDK
jgi:hypothetical protein